MIEKMVLNGRKCYVIICDGCGLRIENATDGVVIMKLNAEVEFRHKPHINAACDVPGEAREEIGIFLNKLMDSLNN